MENKIAILTMAIAAITMLIALGQLIVAMMALSKKKAPANRSWIARSFDWFMFALMIGLSMMLAGWFVTSKGDITRIQIHWYGAAIILYSVSFTMLVARLTLQQVNKMLDWRFRHVHDLALKTDRLERDLLKVRGSDDE